MTMPLTYLSILTYLLHDLLAFLDWRRFEEFLESDLSVAADEQDEQQHLEIINYPKFAL